MTSSTHSISHPSDYAVSLKDIKQAEKLIKSHIHQTPVLTSSYIDSLAGPNINLFFKCELFQKTGAFKYRGAMHAIQKVLHDPKTKDTKVFVTHSSGNHAQALALAARTAQKEAFIVMPTNAPASKRAAVEGYGGKVFPCEPTLKAREETAQKVLSSTPNSFLVPPYDHPFVMAGQGTIALELLEQVPNLDGIIVPVGGGGMLSGITIAAKSINPKIRIWAAEPQNADDCSQSFKSKTKIPVKNPNTIADGLRTSLGDLTWPVIRDQVDEVFTVSEEEIVNAMKLIWQRMKLVIEPSAAVSVAVALGKDFKKVTPKPMKVGVILCGGNVDIDSLPWVTTLSKL